MLLDQVTKLLCSASDRALSIYDWLVAFSVLALIYIGKQCKAKGFMVIDRRTDKRTEWRFDLHYSFITKLIHKGAKQKSVKPNNSRCIDVTDKRTDELMEK